MKERIVNYILNTHIIRTFNIVGIYNDRVKRTEEKIINTKLRYCDERKFKYKTITMFDIISLRPVVEVSDDVIIELLVKNNWIKRIHNDESEFYLNNEISKEFRTTLKRELEVVFESYWMSSAM